MSVLELTSTSQIVMLALVSQTIISIRSAHVSHLPQLSILKLSILKDVCGVKKSAVGILGPYCVIRGNASGKQFSRADVRVVVDTSL